MSPIAEIRRQCPLAVQFRARTESPITKSSAADEGKKIQTQTLNGANQHINAALKNTVKSWS